MIMLTTSMYGQEVSTFENFNKKNIFIPENDIEHLRKGNFLNDSIYFSQEKIRIINTSEIDTVPSFISKILFVYRYAHLLKNPYDSLINSFAELQSRIGTLLKSTSLFYMGIISINSECESFVFMVNSSSTHDLTHKEFYVFNVQNNCLLSIYNIADYYLGHDFTLDYTIVQFPNILIRKHRYESFDTFIDIEENGQTVKETDIQYYPGKTRKYKLNEHGFIEFVSIEY
jgi:hypothetical protein